MSLKFELVVPAYNEAANLEDVVSRAAEAAKSAGFKENEFQLVVVENGSSDNSQEVLAQLKLRPHLSPWFRSVKVTANKGYGFGIWSGLQTVTAPVIGWSHADQQCDPADAMKAALIVLNSPRPIFVKGVRSGRHWKDRLVSQVFEIFSRLILGLKVNELNAQPKVFRKELLAQFDTPPNTFAFDLFGLYVAQKHGYTFQTIPVLFPSRIYGTSNWASNLLSRYKTILNMIRYMFDLAASKGRL